jgi:hypothetical protein
LRRAAEPEVEVERVDEQPTAAGVAREQVEVLGEGDHAMTVRPDASTILPGPRRRKRFFGPGFGVMK